MATKSDNTNNAIKIGAALLAGYLALKILPGLLKKSNPVLPVSGATSGFNDILPGYQPYPQQQQPRFTSSLNFGGQPSSPKNSNPNNAYNPSDNPDDSTSAGIDAINNAYYDGLFDDPISPGYNDSSKFGQYDTTGQLGSYTLPDGSTAADGSSGYTSFIDSLLNIFSPGDSNFAGMTGNSDAFQNFLDLYNQDPNAQSDIASASGDQTTDYSEFGTGSYDSLGDSSSYYDSPGDGNGYDNSGDSSGSGDGGGDGSGDGSGDSGGGGGFQDSGGDGGDSGDSGGGGGFDGGDD